MTEKLFYQDNHIREFEATVLEQQQTENGWRVSLDRSAFYPEGGGQAADKGWLDGFPVKHVAKENGDIAHYLEHKMEKKRIKGLIDWDHRFRAMQQHSGQHIISAAFWKLGQFRTTSVHMGESYTTIEFETETIEGDQLKAGEALANSIIGQNVPITAANPGRDELAQYELRRPTDHEKDVRLIIIEGYDCVACGGIHCSRTGEVGLVKIIGQETIRGNVRIIFKIGSDAYLDYDQKNIIIQELRAELNASDETLLRRARQINAEIIELKREKNLLTQKIADMIIVDLITTNTPQQGVPFRIITRSFENESELLVKTIVKGLMQHSKIAGILVNKKGKMFLWYIFCSENSELHFEELKKTLFKKYGMKGGGRFPLWQGRGEDSSLIESLFSDFTNSLMDSCSRGEMK